MGRKNTVKTMAMALARILYEHHLMTVVWILYVSGSIAGPCVLPWFARPGGTDEKAFQLGVARPQLGTMKTADVMRLYGVQRSRLDRGQGYVDVLHEARMMWEQCLGEWKHDGHRRHGLTWYEYDGGNVPPHAYDVVEATRADGTESVVVIFPVGYDSMRSRHAASLAMALGHGLGWYLQEQEWLAKNVVLLYMDVSKNVTLHAGLKAWVDGVLDGPFDRRIGLVQQAIILDISTSLSDTRHHPSSVTLKMHGWNGQLPNLDMYMMARKNVELYGNARVLVHGTSASSSVTEKIRAFATFVIHHAMGLADGGHAEMLERGIDAMTLEIAMQDDSVHVKGMLQVAEGMVRALNNLQEKLHHATGLYALSGPYGLIDIGMYMGCVALLFLAQVLKTVYAGTRLGRVDTPEPVSWDRAVGKAVLMVACLAYVFIHIHILYSSRLVVADGAGILRGLTTCGYAIVHIAMFALFTWKFCGALVHFYGTECPDSTITSSLSSTKTILAALLTSVSLCLLLYRWSLAWLVLTLTLPFS